MSYANGTFVKIDGETAKIIGSNADGYDVEFDGGDIEFVSANEIDELAEQPAAEPAPSTDWSQVQRQVKNAVDKTAICDLVATHWGPSYVSKSMRKKNLEALREQVLRDIGQRLLENEPAAVRKLREEIARLDQARCGKLNSYHEARDPQKVLDQADELGRQQADLERKLEKMLAA